MDDLFYLQDSRSCVRKQRGYTLFEFAFVLALIIGLGVSATVIYAALHFISKFW